MAKVLYLCGVSGTGKTTIVESYKGQEDVHPFSFSGYMKKYALAHNIISVPEEIYLLPSDTRAMIEEKAWESIEHDKKDLNGVILIDGHLYVEGEAGEIRPTFKDEVGANGYIDEIIFIYLQPEHIIQNRSSRAEFRPQSGDAECIEVLQNASLKRAQELRKNYDITLVIIDNPTNDFAKSAAIVKEEVAKMKIGA